MKYTKQYSELCLAVIAFAITCPPCYLFLLGNKFDACAYLVNLNCSHHTSGTVCASNKITYEDHCEFTKALCYNSSITLDHMGPCEHEKIEQQLVLGIACESLVQMDCESFTGSIKYCGTNGITYPNVCHFEKARCAHQILYLNHFGECRSRR